jgi:hypothetical protein
MMLLDPRKCHKRAEAPGPLAGAFRFLTARIACTISIDLPKEQPITSLR